MVLCTFAVRGALQPKKVIDFFPVQITIHAMNNSVTIFKISFFAAIVVPFLINPQVNP